MGIFFNTAVSYLLHATEVLLKKVPREALVAVVLALVCLVAVLGYQLYHTNANDGPRPPPSATPTPIVVIDPTRTATPFGAINSPRPNDEDACIYVLNDFYAEGTMGNTLEGECVYLATRDPGCNGDECGATWWGPAPAGPERRDFSIHVFWHSAAPAFWVHFPGDLVLGTASQCSAWQEDPQRIQNMSVRSALDNGARRLDSRCFSRAPEPDTSPPTQETGPTSTPSLPSSKWPAVPENQTP
jgi:hypothetical protein